MKAFFVRSTVIVFLGVWTANAKAASCPVTLPAGIIIRVVPDEKLTGGLTSGPTVLTVSSDVRFFPNRPPLIPRGSKVLGTIVDSKNAGRLYGKARLQLGLTTILTADSCEDAIAGQIVEAGKHKVENDVIRGQGHARRDVIALLFPPTTIYQLLRLPSRGPKLIVDGETPLTIKLMETVSLIASAPSSAPGNDERLGAAPIKADEIERVAQTPRLPQLQVARVTSGTCATTEFTARPFVQANKVTRPIRNLTPYHVSVYLDRRPITIMAPCYGPSMIVTPAGDFQLEALANVVTAAGQKQIAVKIVATANGNGWDILPVEEPMPARAN